MDASNLLRSAEELLFDLAMLIVLYPRTLWQGIRHPAALARRIDVELTQEGGKRFDDMVSPPLCLLLSVALGGMLVPGDDSGADVANAFGMWITTSIYNQLMFSALLFSTVPLMFGWLLLRAQGRPFDRGNVRHPFYLQACLVSPMALALPLLVDVLVGDAEPWTRQAAGWLALAVVGTYLLHSTRAAMRELPCGALRGFWLALRALSIALLLSFAFSLALIDPVKLFSLPS